MDGKENETKIQHIAEAEVEDINKPASPLRGRVAGHDALGKGFFWLCTRSIEGEERLMLLLSGVLSFCNSRCIRLENILDTKTPSS